MRIPVLCLCLLAAVSFGACGGDDDDNGDDDDAVIDAAPGAIDSAVPVSDADPAAPDADLTPDAGPAGQPDAMVCNTLSNAAPSITAVRRTAAAPGASGGAIPDGTYYLASDTFYGAPSDMDLGPEQGTAVISGGGSVMQLILSVNGGDDHVSTLTIDAGPGSAISVMQTCPNALDSGWTTYNSAAGTFALHGPGPQGTNTTRVQTWQRQS
jgi:hypothetical protein